MSDIDKKKFTEHSTAQLKKNRKVSVQRSERKERRDIQFGRKIIEKEDGFLDDEYNEELFINQANKNEENKNKKDSKNDNPKNDNKDEVKKSNKYDDTENIVKGENKQSFYKPNKESNYDSNEKSQIPIKKSKSFSKVESEPIKLKKKEIKYSASYHGASPVFTNEYSKTSNYSMDIDRKQSRVSTSEYTPKSVPKPYVHHKDDMSYNDKNEKKTNFDRAKTKYGKLVGSKANVKRAYADIASRIFYFFFF